MHKVKQFGFIIGLLAGLCGYSASAQSKEAVYLFNVLPVSIAEYNNFLPLMLNNARQTRQEPGNIAFDVFGKEQGGTTIYLFEQWQDEAALERHMQTPHLQKVITAVETGVMQPNSQQSSVRLVKLSTDNSGHEMNPPATLRSVIVTFKVKPAYATAFKQTLLEVVAPSRNAPGNLVFDVFQNSQEPLHFVVFEQWESASLHTQHLGQAYNKPITELIEKALSEPLTGNNRLLLKDLAP
ncbi:MAG: putative quinol monooxygenase [Pseudomonadota bacterium]|nr:putative quinol monooxygenase [Pseudomonadota bacterium]